MKKSLISDQNTWVDISRKWSSSFSIQEFLPGVMAVDHVNDILNSAPADVGGSITFGVTRHEVDDIIRRRQVSLNFASGIHYEAAQLIDIPFTQKVNTVMEDFYDVDPKDFRTEKPFLFFQRGNSLEQLLVETISDSQAKKSYKELVKALNEDEPDDSLEEIIADANYWQADFKKLVLARDLAEKFIAEHSNSWETYSDDEKIEALNDYGSDLGVIFDNRKWYDFFRSDLITDIRWATEDPNYDPTDTSYGYTYSTRADGIVYMSDDYKIPKDTIYNLPFALTTVTHECRHQYQGHAVEDTKRYNLPNGLINTWTFDQTVYSDYWTRPWEIDARAWAGLINN